MASSKKNVVAILPARFASTRYPGKPLELIQGRPMIQWTYEAVKRAKLIDFVVVATDDDRIFNAVKGFGGEVVMTSSDHVCGTDRCAEAALKLKMTPDIVVNVQGDEPLVEPDHVDAAVSLLLDPNNDSVVGTLVSRLEGENEVTNVNRVKVVLDRQNHILYFSRGLIPHNKKGKFDPTTSYYRHIGLMAFSASFLQKFQSLPTSILQSTEDVELIKVLEYGYRIKAALVTDAHPGVDSPQDLISVNEYLASKAL